MYVSRWLRVVVELRRAEYHGESLTKVVVKENNLHGH